MTKSTKKFDCFKEHGDTIQAIIQAVCHCPQCLSITQMEGREPTEPSSRKQTRPDHVVTSYPLLTLVT